MSSAVGSSAGDVFLRLNRSPCGKPPAFRPTSDFSLRLGRRIAFLEA